jgi:choline dehydrogenase
MEISNLKLLLLVLSSSTPAWAVSRARSSPYDNLGRTFDYVIVGGGTAGLTVANRLTEDPSVSVAVIEAGTFTKSIFGNISQVPGYQQLIINTIASNPLAEWGFETTPQAVRSLSPLLFPHLRRRTPIDIVIYRPKMVPLSRIIVEKLCV